MSNKSKKSLSLGYFEILSVIVEVVCYPNVTACYGMPFYVFQEFSDIINLC